MKDSLNLLKRMKIVHQEEAGFFSIYCSSNNSNSKNQEVIFFLTNEAELQDIPEQLNLSWDDSQLIFSDFLII